MTKSKRKSRAGKRDNSELNPPILSCRRVSKAFGALVAVNKLSFNVQAGTVFGIGGPNGAGKTTLFDVICGISPATGGDILLKGKSISRLQPHEVCHEGVARTFQLNAAFETMTVRQNVLLAAHHGHSLYEIPRVFYSAKERQQADHSLEVTGLIEKADTTVSDLNLFEHKLLMIAGALATNPSMLLMDEPVGGLVPQEIDLVENVVRRLTNEYGLTVILIEHVMRFIVGLSDEVMIMNQGTKLYQGTPQGLAQDKEVVEVYLGEGASGQSAFVRNKQGVDATTPVADVEGLDEPQDKWDQDVEKLARQLVKQFYSGRLYPIDYMELEKLIEGREEDEKTTKVARAVRGLLRARKAGNDEGQHFELLSRILEERHLQRSKIVSRPTMTDASQQRAKAIEEAARRIVEAESRDSISKADLDQLRAAFMWQIATADVAGVAEQESTHG